MRVRCVSGLAAIAAWMTINSQVHWKCTNIKMQNQNRTDQKTTQCTTEWKAELPQELRWEETRTLSKYYLYWNIKPRAGGRTPRTHRSGGPHACSGASCCIGEPFWAHQNAKNLLVAGAPPDPLAGGEGLRGGLCCPPPQEPHLQYCHCVCNVQGGPKKVSLIIFIITLSTANQFS